MLAHAQERDAAPAEFGRYVAEGAGAVRIAHGMDIAARRQVHAHAARAPDADAGVGRFQQQARAVLHRAAVIVIAQIGAVLQELVQQVAVGRMHFHAVETRFLRHLRAQPVGLDHAGQLRRFQRARVT